MDGVPQREHWEAAAERGSVAARARLESASLPEELEYLWEWAIALHGRSGLGMAGIAPLTYSTIAEWARLTGNEPDALEIEALMSLDAAMMTRSESAEKKASGPKGAPVDPWPEKKRG